MNDSVVEPTDTPPKPFLSEDWQAVLIGTVFLLICVATVAMVAPDADGKLVSPLKAYLSKPGSWESNPLDGLSKPLAILGPLILLGAVFAAGLGVVREKVGQFLPAFVVVFLLATFSYVLAEQSVIKYYGLSYALWALLTGMMISNTIGTPAFLKPAVRTELYMKVGLVLLGAEILLGNLISLGLPGIFISWVVTPIVLISTYWFGQKVLKISSKSLNMVVSADMSVCGVSAAIATAGACKAKKEELSLAIGISLTFTVIMMVVMPPLTQALGMSQVLAGAWIGGTIDATGAVGAAGALIGEDALKVATTIKMIQNILIGVIAFAVACYWVAFVERGEGDTKPDAGEIWRRFPKFVLGFIAASIIFSALREYSPEGKAMVEGMISGSSKTLRGWCFCLAFVSIGLDTNFRELGKYLQGGKPLLLYVCGQTLNLILTLFMAWLMFYVVFPDAASALQK